MTTQSRDWCVEALELENFRSFEYFQLELEPDLTVLVGRNGVGKTAVLDALAVLLSPVVAGLGGESKTFAVSDARSTAISISSVQAVAHMRTTWPVRASTRGKIAGFSTSWTAVRSRQNQSRTAFSGPEVREIAEHFVRHQDDAAQQRYAAPVLSPLIATYGVDRSTPRSIGRTKTSPSEQTPYATALDSRFDLRSAGEYLSELLLVVAGASAFGEARPDAAIAQVRAFDEACDRILGETGWRQPRWNPRIKQLTLNHDVHGTLPLSSLSSGIRTTAGLVLDLVARAARANPSFGDAQLLEAPGIVLIDEVDLHLHPEWQKSILRRLVDAFPSVQFVVTTHSPQVLSHTDARHVRDVEDPERQILYSSGLRPEDVLRSVMHTDPEPDDTPQREQLHRYMELVFDGLGRTQEAVALRRWLQDEMGGTENVRELSEADAHMAFEGILDE